MLSLRTWISEMVAIAGDIAINVSVLGPAGGNIPSLTKKHLTPQKLAENWAKVVPEINLMQATTISS